MNNKLMELITDITDLEYTINLINWELRISGSNESKDYLIDVISRLEKKYYNLLGCNRLTKTKKQYYYLQVKYCKDWLIIPILYTIPNHYLL